MNRKIIIGDIHGCFYELQCLLDKIGPNKDDEIISVGDFVDRGPSSLEVVKFFRQNQNTVAIKGNHERKHSKRFLVMLRKLQSCS